MRFNEFPEWVCWVAQDADGSWWGFQVEPNQSHQSWYENEVGLSICLDKESVNPNWVESLKQIK